MVGWGVWLIELLVACGSCRRHRFQRVSTLRKARLEANRWH